MIDIFLSKYYDPADPTLPPLGNVITLSSPHEGAPLSTAAGQARSKTSGRIILDDLVGDGFGLVPPAGSVAVRQLAEGSPTIRSLFPHGLPDHVDYTTIGADTDSVVPATNISVPGATETVITGGDLDVAERALGDRLRPRCAPGGAVRPRRAPSAVHQHRQGAPGRGGAGAHQPVRAQRRRRRPAEAARDSGPSARSP